MKIKKITRVTLESPIPVYDISVFNDDHNFRLATGIWSHNCILDSYYTIKLKEMLYDSNYDGLKNGYPYFITQSHLASMIDSNGVSINIDQYDKINKWNNESLLESARFVATYPPLVKIMMKDKIGTEKWNKVTEATVNYITSIKSGRVLNGLKSLFCNSFDPVEKITNLVSKLIELSGTPKRSIRGKLPDEDTKGLFDLFSILDSHKYLGILSTSVDSNDPTNLIDKFNEIKSLILSQVNIDEDKLESEYINWVNTTTDWKAILDSIDFTSGLVSKGKKFSEVLLEDPEVRLSLLRINLMDSVNLSGEFKALPSEYRARYDTNKKLLAKLDQFTSGEGLDDLDRQYSQAVLNTINKGRENTDWILQGHWTDRDARWRVTQAIIWTLQDRGELPKDEFTKDDVDKLPLLKFANCLTTIKRDLKARSTLLDGKLGGNSFMNVSDPLHPIRDDSGGFKVFRHHLAINSKDTLRSSDSFHTIPPASDYTSFYTTRSKDRILVHLDLSQAEARLSFSLAGAKSMISAMRNNLDLHSFNTNIIYDLGYKDDELDQVKEKYDNLRKYCKSITFAILYGAGVGSIAAGMGKSREEGQALYDKYMVGNPELKNFIDNSRQEIRDKLGYIKLPIFGFEFFVVNPFNYHINQKALNYQIQNISSSICAHLAYLAYRDLKDNYGVELYIHGFIHDAIEADFPVDKLFIVKERFNYWFKEFPYHEWNCPMDYDCEFGIDKCHCSEFKTTKVSDDVNLVTFKMINHPYEDIDIVDETIRRLSTGFDILNMVKKVNDSRLNKLNAYKLLYGDNSQHNYYPSLPGADDYRKVEVQLLLKSR